MRYHFFKTLLIKLLVQPETSPFRWQKSTARTTSPTQHERPPGFCHCWAVRLEWSSVFSHDTISPSALGGFDKSTRWHWQWHHHNLQLVQCLRN